MADDAVDPYKVLREEVYGYFERFVRNRFPAPVGQEQSGQAGVSLLAQQLTLATANFTAICGDVSPAGAEASRRALGVLDLLSNQARREIDALDCLRAVRQACMSAGKNGQDWALTEAYVALASDLPDLNLHEGHDGFYDDPTDFMAIPRPRGHGPEYAALVKTVDRLLASVRARGQQT